MEKKNPDSKGIIIKEGSTGHTGPSVVNAEHVYPLSTFDGVGKFRSVWRAMRRGRVSQNGVIYPKRPFNNSKATIGRKENEFRKVVYNNVRKLQGKSSN